MKAKELREKGKEELKAEAKKLSEDLFKLRFEKATNQIKNKAQIRVKRRGIARVMTILAEKGA